MVEILELDAITQTTILGNELEAVRVELGTVELRHSQTGARRQSQPSKQEG